MSTKEHIAQLMAQITALQAQLARRSQSPPPAPAQPSTAPPPPPKPPKVSAPSPFSGVQDDLDRFKAKCSLYLSMRHSEFPDEHSNALFVLSYMKGGSTGPVTTSSPGDGIGPEASRLGLSHLAGPSVTRSAKVSQRYYSGIIIVILTKGKPVPLVWEFIYKLGEVTRVISTILPNMGRKCVTEA